MVLRQKVILLVVVAVCSGEFFLPEITLEAYKPKGFRASIPDIPGLQLFGFHGNLNKGIKQHDRGEFMEENITPSKGRLSYFNADLELKLGDEIFFWISIQHDKLSYRKDNQKWIVTDLVEANNGECIPSETVVLGRPAICNNTLIFEDSFKDQINPLKWQVQEYIAHYAEDDFEFVSYQRKICRIVNGKLQIKPVAASLQSEVEGILDLTASCTRKKEEECKYTSDNTFILPPITSGRMVSLLNFRYGKVEIKAKLPAGDWIYPQMYLEQVGNPSRKIFIGYARGNDALVGKNSEDIGGRTLYGGLVLDSSEPERSHYLKFTKSKSNTFTSQEHTFTLIWRKDYIGLQVDGQEYGSIPEETMRNIKFSESDTVRLVLGVGVGGINDFPDEFQSGNIKKPWRNAERNQVFNFFSARSDWQGTWSTERAAFEISRIKVFAI